MAIKRMYGLEMRLPEGKLPGYYAQIVKSLADQAPPFDRYKELLIFESVTDFPAVLHVLDHYRVPSDRVDLLLLPAEFTEPGDLYEDYAIVTRSANVYVDQALTAVFVLKATKPDAEPAPALLQLKEHLVASLDADGETFFMIDRQLAELAERIATAFGCGVQWRFDEV